MKKIWVLVLVTFTCVVAPILPNDWIWVWPIISK